MTKQFARKLLLVGGLSSILVATVTVAQGERFAQLTMPELRPDQDLAAQEALKMSGSGLHGPYNVMLRSPVMAERLLPLEEYLRYETSLPHRLNEFAILILARQWRSQVEWDSHFSLAIKAGLPKSVATDLQAGRRPASMRPDEAAIYDFCTELAETHEISNPTFRNIRTILSDRQVVDLIAVSGTYVTFAMMLAVSQEDPVDGSMPLPSLSVAEHGQDISSSR